MSVINQMLQDLDARSPGRPGHDALAAVQALAPAAPPRWRRVVVIGLIGVLVAMAAVALWLVRAPSPMKKAPVVAAVAPAPVVKTIVLAPAPAPPPAPVPAPQPEAIEAPAPQPVAKTVLPPPAAPAVRPEPAAAAPSAASPNRIDSPYRRALALLHDGRREDAMTALEQLLRTDARNGAARETLVGLLMEAHRVDEAMAQLQAGLAADPRQGAMAMLLARLQIERGGDGIDTLLRSLPFVDGPEKGAETEPQAGAAYHAFLAGALQRRQRHREAVQQYQAALATAPDNGVWLMGLGLSLRADGRSADSREAFMRARASASLSPQLDVYVERQLQELAPR